MRPVNWFLDLLYPPKCTFCRALLRDQETDLCGKCRRTLPLPETPERKGEYFTSCRATLAYCPPVSDAIQRFKFYGVEHYAATFGRLMAMTLLDTPFDVLTWVPLSRMRRWKRGYDQSYLLARAVAKELGTVCVRTLRKTRNNPAQSRQPNAAARRANVRNLFRAVDPQNFAGKRVLLIDDVIATGSTLSECSRVLLTSGASEVVCAALAAAQQDNKQ